MRRPFLAILSFGLSLVLASSPLLATPPWQVGGVADRAPSAPDILIINDMEGLAGQDDIYTADDLNPAYALGRELLTADINAVVDGLFAGGARSVKVLDGHGPSNFLIDLIPEKLDPRATLITERLSATERARRGEYDGVVLVGHHAGAGSGGFYAHTSTLGTEIILNGRPINETDLLAISFGEIDTPIIFASGDDVLARQISHMPWIETVVVKHSTSVDTTTLVPVAQARAALSEGAARAVRKIGAARVLRARFPLEVGLKAYGPADLSWMAKVPGINFRGATFTFTARNLADLRSGLNGLFSAVHGSYARTIHQALAASPHGKAIEYDAVMILTRQWVEAEKARQAETAK